MTREQNIKGIQYMLLSTSAFTIMNTMVKYLDAIPTFEIVFFRSLGTSILCFLILSRAGIPMLGNKRKLLLARGINGVISMVLFFAVVKLIPFGSSVSLRYVAPIFAAILAVIFLRERISLIQWICFLIAFIGVLLLKGVDSRVSVLGLSLILLSAFFSGIVYILIRQIGQQDHPLVIVNYFMFIGAVVGGTISIFQWQQPNTAEWMVLISLGLLGFVGQLYMTKAYQIAAIATVAPMKYLEAVFALLVGFYWFGEGYTFLALLGVALIIGGMLLNIFASIGKK